MSGIIQTVLLLKDGVKHRIFLRIFMDFADVLVVGLMMNAMLRHCDRVKIACLAQLVNVIAPIMTENGGKARRQTIFYPYKYVSIWQRQSPSCFITFNKT